MNVKRIIDTSFDLFSCLNLIADSKIGSMHNYPLMSLCLATNRTRTALGESGEAASYAS